MITCVGSEPQPLKPLRPWELAARLKSGPCCLTPLPDDVAARTRCPRDSRRDAGATVRRRDYGNFFPSL